MVDTTLTENKATAHFAGTPASHDASLDAQKAELKRAIYQQIAGAPPHLVADLTRDAETALNGKLSIDTLQQVSAHIQQSVKDDAQKEKDKKDADFLDQELLAADAAAQVQREHYAPLSAAAVKRVEHQMRHIDLENPQSVFSYAMGMTDETLTPTLRYHQATVVADFMKNSPEGHDYVNTMNGAPRAVVKAVLTHQEQDRAFIEAFLKEHPGLGHQQRDALNLGLIHKLFNHHGMHETIEKWKDGALSLEKVLVALTEADHSFDHKRNLLSAKHPDTAQEHKIKGHCHDVPDAAALLVIYKNLELHPDLMKTAKEAANDLLTAPDHASKYSKDQVNAALAWLHSNPLTIEASMQETAETVLKAQAKGHTQDVQKYASVLNDTTSKKTQRDDAIAHLSGASNNAFLTQYQSIYKSENAVAKAASHIESIGALDALAHSATTAAAIVGDMAANFNITDKKVIAQVSHTGGLATKHFLETHGVSKETAQAVGHTVTQTMIGAKEKLDSVVAAVSHPWNTITGHTASDDIDKYVEIFKMTGLSKATTKDGKKLFYLSGDANHMEHDLAVIKQALAHAHVNLDDFTKGGDLDAASFGAAMRKVIQVENATTPDAHKPQATPAVAAVKKPAQGASHA